MGAERPFVPDWITYDVLFFILFQECQPLLALADLRLEFTLVQQTVTVGVDQPGNAAP